MFWALGFIMGARLIFHYYTHTLVTDFSTFYVV